MSLRTRSWQTWLVGAGLALVGLGCTGPTASLTGPQGCVVDAPCDTDPSKTCQVPCKGNVGAAGIGAGSGGSTGGTGSGGSAGSGSGSGGVLAIDVSGHTVAFSTQAFSDTVPFVDPITVLAEAPDGKTIQSDTLQGNFTLTGVAEEPQWLFAQHPDGAAGAVFSTFSAQDLLADKMIALPVVPVDVLDSVAIQIDVPALQPNRAHLVLQLLDEKGIPVPDISIDPFVGGTKFAYDVAPGQYSVNTPGTGTLGFAIALNVAVPGPGSVDIHLTRNGKKSTISLPIAENTVTYGRLSAPAP